MKLPICFLLIFCIPLVCQATSQGPTDSEGDRFLKQHPKSYQDVIIHNETKLTGTNICPPRYELIKPVFDQYEGHFKVLDIGAAQGYFSFKIAHDYPKATCVMVEGDSEYLMFRGMLSELCVLNSYLKNIFYLNKAIDLNDLRLLNEKEHFDVILAFLVIHQMSDQDEIRMKIIDELLKLGDNVIIEVSNNVAPSLAVIVEQLAMELKGQYLGELQRMYASKGALGKFYWFKKENLDADNFNQAPPQTISEETFKRLNGIYPPEQG